MGKTFVKVTAEHDESGQVRPLFLTWTDGRKYEIDRVTDVRQAPSLRGGGLGMRYTVKVRGKQVYLFEDEGRWFLEGGGKIPALDETQTRPGSRRLRKAFPSVLHLDDFVVADFFCGSQNCCLN